MYICEKCKFKSSIHTPRCKSCGEIGTMTEVLEQTPENHNPLGKVIPAIILPQKYKPGDKGIFKLERYKFKTESLNLLFWGGLVKGSVNFLSAEPGAGKSTFLGQLPNLLEGEVKVLYYSGEENEAQVWNRLERLHWKGSPYLDQIALYYGKDISIVLGLIEQGAVDIVIVDSINSLAWESYTKQAEYMSQVTASLKRNNITGFIIGHINKSGEISGKKTLEHEVDAVFMLSGQDSRADNIRILKVLKQRFGETDNVTVMEMGEKGFRIIDSKEAFKIFITESTDIAGSVFCPVLEGNQIFLLEIQSLLVEPIYNYPQKIINGWIKVKADTVLAILSKYLKMSVFKEQDIIVNVIAPSNFSLLPISFAVAMSLISSQTGINLKKYIFIWEIGLGWEIRTIARQEEIVKRLINMGYKEENIITRKNFQDIVSCTKYFTQK